MEIRCDLCGFVETSPGERPEREEASWSRKPFYDEGVTVSCAKGSSDPDGGSDHEVTRFDICPKCFRERLMPWLISQGAKPTVFHSES